MSSWNQMETERLWKFLIVACLVTMICFFGTAAVAEGPQKEDVGAPKRQRTIALGADEVKRLLFLMDADKNGKISKKEFMRFMEAEFDWLDKDKSGELDAKELAQSQMRPSRRAPVGK